jgi:hypothetical protein
MSTAYNKMVRSLGPALFAAGCILGGLTAANAITDLVHVTPRVGDIVAFAPATDLSAGDDVRLIAHRQNQFDCALDLNTLRQSGGSLVIESQIAETAGMFRAHWAGEHTTADIDNCGSSADLILDASDLDRLAISAGGYGVGAKRKLVFTTAAGT